MNRPRGKADDEGAKLGPLIVRLGPLNNQWRGGGPPEKVLKLWDMGNVIVTAVPDPSDALLWEIQERSYITRNLLRYALILRRSWEQRNKLEELVRGLRSYTVFREALPFLKGSREDIDDTTYEKVVSLLIAPNSQEAIRYLKGLKAKKIGRRHKKGASAEAIRSQAISFEQALTRLEAEVNSGSALEPLGPPHLLVTLSQMAVAVATGEIAENLPRAAMDAGDRLLALAEPLIAAVQGGRAAAAAFRKMIGAERLMQAADLLNSIQNESTIVEWRRRRGTRLSVGARPRMWGSES